MEPKRLGLLRDLAPGVPLIGVLLNPSFTPYQLPLRFARNPSFCIAGHVVARQSFARRVGVIGASRLDFRQVAPYRDPTAWLRMQSEAKRSRGRFSLQFAICREIFRNCRES